MNDVDDLTKRILKWQETGENFDLIIREISQLVLTYPKKHYGWDEEQCADFFCFFYPQCLKLIRCFRFQGSAFQALLNNSLRWQVNSFYRNLMKKQRLDESVYQDCIIENEVVCEQAGRPVAVLEPTASVRSVIRVDESGMARSCWMRRRLLLLTLKTAPFITEAQIAALARLTGYDKDILFAMIEQLRIMQESHFRRHRDFCRRVNRAYIEICRLHLLILNEVSENERRRLHKRLDKVRKRLHRAEAGRAAVQLMPTNSEISRLLNIPKGSVDSGLYYLKKSLSKLQTAAAVSDEL